jgi:hypothetical protein
MASTTASTWGPKGFTGDVCAHGYVVGSCDGGLLRAGVPQVANESFGVFDVEATCLVEVPLVSGGPRSWPRWVRLSRHELRRFTGNQPFREDPSALNGPWR